MGLNHIYYCTYFFILSSKYYLGKPKLFYTLNNINYN